MPAVFEVKMLKIGNSLRVVVPKPAAQGLGWGAGTKLKLTVTDHQVVMEEA
ncbi:MAG: AbrB/MazE/SpoVT family DNA-binding domain-containing protein [Nitrososphaerota archaeon]|nr:AbrB/MazE/SpoVT family DNA-binding domain-containing protein [Nitrososphaerota archaeon]